MSEEVWGLPLNAGKGLGRVIGFCGGDGGAGGGEGGEGGKGGMGYCNAAEE